MLALWGWLLGVAAASVIAWANGGSSSVIAGAAAWALAPALAGFALAPRLDERWPGAFFIAVWLIAAAFMMGGSGGAVSPLSVTLALAPAWTLALGKPWLREAGAGAVIAYAVVALAASSHAAPQLGPLPELLGVFSLAFAVGLMALAQRPGAGSASTAGARVAEVSHELRTPLTHILGFSEMIERQIFGPIGERYVEYAGLIRKSGNHLLALVNDLLDLSRLEAGRYELEVEAFDARAVVEEVVRLAADAAERKSIALGMLTPEQPLNVRADARALRRILINTLANALKFTPEGGRVFVTAHAEADALILETIDNGPGIPEAERARLGAPFERGASGARAEGTGLGLALVRALAGLHGGNLSFHDAPGGGALVRVTLPVLTEA